MSDHNAKIAALLALGTHFRSNDEAIQEVKALAAQANSWFTAAHVDMAIANIASEFLTAEKLIPWAAQYTPTQTPKRVGIICAGNIPLVGFHDLLCGYLSGHTIVLKLSSKDTVLMRYVIEFLKRENPAGADCLLVSDQLKGCDAYIVTGSNNTAGHFEQYFAKYPNIIRRNRTSVAVLDGSETEAELHALGEDVFAYFGLGCRNITQVCLPRGYEVSTLLKAFAPFEKMIDHHKYRNNYDYHLAVYLLNKVPYLTNEFLLMVENETPFSAVSVLHYRFYDDADALYESFKNNTDIQCVVGKKGVPFGAAQKPSLYDYADGVDVPAFLSSL